MQQEDWNALAEHLGYPTERDMLRDLYMNMPLAEIAFRLNVSKGTVNRRMNLLGLPKRAKGGPNNNHSQTFKLWRMDQRIVHSFACKDIAGALSMSPSTVFNYVRNATCNTKREEAA